jgi:hypothetical protein
MLARQHNGQTRGRQVSRLPETPRDRLFRIGTNRVNNTVKALQLLKHLANGYDLKQAEAAKIVTLLRSEVDGVERALSNDKQAVAPVFDDYE